MKRTLAFVGVSIALVAVGTLLYLKNPAITAPFSSDYKPAAQELAVVKVAIAPYQDLAMLVTAPALGFDVAEGISIELITLAWEEILPAVASARKPVDCGFGSYVEYLTKFEKLNQGTDDPVQYVQPLYLYTGGGFITLNDQIPHFDAKALQDPDQISLLTNYRIGAQKESLYDMMIYSIAARAQISPSELDVVDISMNDGILALETSSLDLSSAGLTQVTEATKRGGRLAIAMKDAGFADITGLICRKSTVDEKQAEIEALIEAWFRSVDYVYSDLEKNSVHSLKYLRTNAATNYTFEEYRSALSQEYLPRSIEDLEEAVLAKDSKFDWKRIGSSINDYLVTQGIIQKPAPHPQPLLPQPKYSSRTD